MAFTQYPLPINPSKIAVTVMALRHLWIRRDPDHPFYTLGRCAYLDGKTPAYAAEIAQTNPILYENFADLYKVLQNYFESYLGEKVYLSTKLAYPSFHIAAADPFFLNHGGVWHEDYPHETLGLGNEDPLTFTLAIEMPTGGGGLDYIEDGQQNHIEYVEGSIVVHDGAITHRISNFKECHMGDFRITLQGHLVRIDGQLVMFW